MKSDWHEKPWGRWRLLNLDAPSEVRELAIRAGGFCSRHYHETKSNQFIVVEGVLAVRLWTPNGEVQRCSIRRASPVIPAGTEHQFCALTDVRCYEISVAVPGHWLDPEEIVRVADALAIEN